MNKTSIEWCDHTLNPVVGCSKCSPGCDNCYAERIAAMRAKHPNPKISGKYAGVVDEHGKWTGRLNYDLSVMDNLPKKPSRIFIGSMTDLFHENATYSNVDNIFLAMSKYPFHTFLILTKRPERMRSYVTWCCDNRRIGVPATWPLPNAWLGVTVCNQAEADAKIPVLLDTPAAKRFVSVEPMLGPVSLPDHFLREHCKACKGSDRDYTGCYSTVEGHFSCNEGCDTTAYPWDTHWIKGLDWVICGGETGLYARPMHPRWVQGLRDQCADAGVPFFFKNWGEWHPWGEKLVDGNINLLSFRKAENKYQQLEGAIVSRIGKRRSGRLLDGREWNEVPL